MISISYSQLDSPLHAQQTLLHLLPPLKTSKGLSQSLPQLCNTLPFEDKNKISFLSPLSLILWLGYLPSLSTGVLESARLRRLLFPGVLCGFPLLAEGESLPFRISGMDDLDFSLFNPSS